MRAGRVAACVLLAACGGRDGQVAAPSPPASVRVVRCAPATPPPMISGKGLDVDPLGTARELARFRLRGQTAREASPPPKIVELDAIVIVSGVLDRGVVMKELKRPGSSYERCVVKHAAEQKTAATMTSSFDLAPDGSVRIVTSTGTATTELRACINEAIRQVRIPSPGEVSRVSVRFKLDPAAAAPRAPEARVELPSIEPWTPYAISVGEPADGAAQIARSLEVALGRTRDTLDGCFADSKVTGSLRAMLELDAEGRIVAARVGGLGDKPLEICVGEALSQVSVAPPSAEAVEIACDLSRGDAAPWRVTPDAGYEVIHASSTKLTHGAHTLTLADADVEALAGGESYLVIVDPETPGALIDRAFDWAHEGDGTLVAMRSPSGAPVLLGAARSIYAVATDAPASETTVAVGSHAVTTCERTARRRGVTSTVSEAPIAEPSAVSKLIGELAAGCRPTTCAGTLGISVGKATAARDLVEVVSAARRHGFERVLLGSASCTKAPAYDILD